MYSKTVMKRALRMVEGSAERSSQMAQTDARAVQALKDSIDLHDQKRISPEGIANIKSQWKACPRNCGIKHRTGHPHLQAGGEKKPPRPVLVAAKKKPPQRVA